MGGQVSGCAVMARAATMLALIIGPRNSHFNPLNRIMLITPSFPIPFTRRLAVSAHAVSRLSECLPSAFEADALWRFSRPHKDVTESKQNKILGAASRAEQGKIEEGVSQRASMREHFENIKRWVGDAYYSSEAGMKELGWTNQVFFKSFPGYRGSGNGIS